MWRFLRYSVRYSIFAWMCLGLVACAAAGDVVPAGTLLQCTIDEPNFSAKTAAVGDPVVCYLKSVQQFGHIVLPRGSYLEGHLAAEKLPGHFFGKGYLRIDFDRIGLPNGEIPVPSKVISSDKYKADHEGDLIGKGNVKRDVVEWMLPPLWPWKMITLPARGPAPTLKGEVQITLRLMDDVVVPNPGEQLRPAAAVAPPPAATPGWRYFGPGPQANQRPYYPQTAPVPQPSAQYNAWSAPPAMPPARVTLIALWPNEVLGVTLYWIQYGRINFVLANGARGWRNAADVDWVRTSQLNPTRPS